MRQFGVQLGAKPPVLKTPKPVRDNAASESDNTAGTSPDSEETTMTPTTTTITSATTTARLTTATPNSKRKKLEDELGLEAGQADGDFFCAPDDADEDDEMQTE